MTQKGPQQVVVNQKSKPKPPPRPSTRVRPTLLIREVPKAEPLVRSPSSKDARLRISEYVSKAEREGLSFNIMSRGKHIAILGPVTSLPKTITVQKTVTISEIATGKPTFSSVIHFGPYMVRRRSKEVAVLYSPQPTEHSKLENLLQKLDELEIIKLGSKMLETDLKGEITRLSEVRRKAEAMAKARIDYLRLTGQVPEADKLYAELNQIIAGDKNV